MSIRPIPFLPGEYYHLYNRGNNKREIFHDNYDYERFIKLLYLSNSKLSIKTARIKFPFEVNRGQELVNIGAYCLMPNHFHILIKQPEEGDISRFLQKLLTSYSMYYNAKYKKTGGLFEGKFKSQHVGDDIYLKYIFSYIHLNPIKLIDSGWKDVGVKNSQKTLAFLNTYKYSSYLDYLEKNRKERSILGREEFPNYFPNKENFEKEILDWVNLNSPI